MKSRTTQRWNQPEVWAAKREQAGPSRSRAAGFTLIELLVVMAIIAVLAGLILTLGPAVYGSNKRKLAQAQLEQLVTIIDTYKEDKGFYPPDNPASTYMNSLFFELTGAGTNLLPQADAQYFGVGGILNSVEGGGSKNFFKNIRDSQYRTIPGTNLRLLALKASGFKPPTAPPMDWPWDNYTPWHYRVAKPDPAAPENKGMHNPHSYDLWAVVLVGGELKTFGNWKEGQ